MHEGSFGGEVRRLLAAREMSLRELARRIPIDAGQLSRVVSAKRVPTEELARRCDEILHSGDVLKSAVMHLRPTMKAAPTVADQQFWDGTQTADTISSFTRKDLSMDRRQVTQLAVSMAFGSALLEPLEGWLSHTTWKPAGGRPSALQIREVEEIENTAELFRQWDNQYGGGLRRKAVVGQLSEVAEILRDRPHPPLLAQRLFGVMAQLAQTAASMSWDSGQGPLAQRYYIMALKASRESGDRQFGANVLAGMARQLLYLGRPGDALELVRLAQDGVDQQAAPEVHAMLKTREAWAHANAGRLGAFRRATSRAEDILRDTTASVADIPYWIRYFDEAELAGVTGGRLLQAAHQRPHLAADSAACIERAIALRRSTTLRSSALDYIGLAEARLLQREAEEAVRVGHEAMSVVERTDSHRAHVKLAEFYDVTHAHKGTPIVAELRERIREHLAA